MKPGGESLQQLYNRGYDFILNTYGSAENIIPSNNYQTLLIKGLVIDIDFNITKNYKLAAEQPPFSIYAKIIGEDLDTANPALDVEEIFYSPLLPIHNLSIPEIGEEIIIMREGTAPGTKGYYMGRVSNTSTLNYYPARHYMDSTETGITSPEFKYGFSWEVDEIREKRKAEMPPTEIQALSIPVTFGDVVQQGRTQTYIRHSFNRNNKKGVLEQGLRFQQQNSNVVLNNTVGKNRDLNSDPSIGETATKTIHFVDTSIKKLGDYGFASGAEQGNTANPEKSIIANIADEIYNISTEGGETLYRQVLGEKLISHQIETNSLIQDMLGGMKSLTEVTQDLLQAFVIHQHTVPEVELKTASRTVKVRDNYRIKLKPVPQPDVIISVPGTPDTTLKVPTGRYFRRYVPNPRGPGGKWVNGAPRMRTVTIPGKPAITRSIPQPDKQLYGARTRFRRVAIRGQNIRVRERLTDPIQQDEGLDGLEKTEIGIMTNNMEDASSTLLNKVDQQKNLLDRIVTRANEFLSRNQFIN